MKFATKKRNALRLAAITLIGTLAGCLLVPTQAFATENTDIVVTADPLLKSDLAGQEYWAKQAFVGDVVKLKFIWDASKANPQPGQSFSIGLPNELKNMVSPLKADLNANDEKLGECDLTERNIVCVFSDAVSGKTNLKGMGTALLIAQAETTGETVNLKLNGKETPVSIIHPIGAKPAPQYLPAGFEKVTAPFVPGQKSVLWEISFDPNTVLQPLGEAADGTARKTFVVDEQLQPGMKFAEELKKFTLVKGNNATNPMATKVKLTDAAGIDAVTDFGDFDLEVVKHDDRKATLSVTGPFDPNSNYHIYVPTVPDTADGAIQHNVRYTNTAAVVNTKLRAEFTRLYIDPFFTVSFYEKALDPLHNIYARYGNFHISKVLSGEAVSAVPAGTKFKLRFVWELSPQLPLEDYPDWAATAENPMTMDIVWGKVNQSPVSFPVGTQICIEEDMEAAINLVPGVSWGIPKHYYAGNSEPEVGFSASDEYYPTCFTVTYNHSMTFYIENIANFSKGSFQVVNTVTGDDAAAYAEHDFVFDYSCVSGTAGKLTVKGNGTAVESPAIKAGDTCTVTEDAASAERAGYTLAAVAPQEVTIAADSVTPLSFKNVYSRDLGGFSVTKTVVGVSAGEVQGRGYVFNYVCEDAFTGKKLEGAVKVAADGKPVIVNDKLSIGSKCELSEDVESAQLVGYDLKAPEAQTATVTENGKTVQLDFVNEYSVKPAPVVPVEPGEPVKPADKQPVSPKLAKTGAGVEPLVWAAVLLFGGAAATFAARYRVKRER